MPVAAADSILQVVDISKKILHHNTLSIRPLVGLIWLLPSVKFVLWRCIEDVEISLPSITDFQHTRHVPAPIAIIGSAPYRAEAIIIQHLISLLAELVRTEYMCHRIDVQKLLDHLSAEGIARPSWTETELIPLRIRIAPHQVSHWYFVGYFPKAINNFDLIYAMNAWAQPSMHTKYIVVDDYTEREEVKHVGEVMPYVCVAIFPVTFCVETVGLSDAARLVVASDQVYAVGVSEFETDEERDRFYGKEASVDVVAWKGRSAMHLLFVLRRFHSVFRTQKEIVGIRAESTNLKDLYHIKKLPMYIPNNSDRRCNMYNIAFPHQELLGFGAYCFNHGFRQKLFLVQPFYALI